MLFAKAAEGPLPDEAKDYETAELRLLVSLCRELQREAGDKPFFLDCRTAGSLLKVNHATVARWLHGLQYDGILKLVERGDHGKRRANRYRYVAEL